MKRNAWGVCDVCGWKYRRKELRKNSYGVLVCPTDYDGKFDTKNHPQNRNARIIEDVSIKNARPDSFLERQKEWENINNGWDDLDEHNWEFL